MPLYEYECDACGHRFEQIQKFSDRPVEKCPACGAAALHKLISSPAIQFKGSGWYVTDYARKDQPAAKAEPGDSRDAATKAGGESTDQKTDQKESKAEKEPASRRQPRRDMDSKLAKESKGTEQSKDGPADKSPTGTARN